MRNWISFEQSYERRIKCAARELYTIVKCASSVTLNISSTGRRPKVAPEQKVVILLLKEIFSLSNRKMADLLSLFGPLAGIDIRYKKVEGAYSSLQIRLIIHNMFSLLASDGGGNLSGDGIGDSMPITRHY